MCGVAGYINFRGKPVEQQVLKDMAEALAHRGPDGQSTWTDDNVGLAHRRLAVIDLSALAKQPMISADRRYALVFNGMIYNFQELRSELQAFGYEFSSQSDSEVLLYSLIHWGKHALNRFNGMFAFAFWDCREKTMMLGRDRYGIKPLYYYQTDDIFAFGSESKSILAIPEVKRILDREALFEYFSFQNLFTDKTLFKNINILPAGHFGLIKLGSAKPSLQVEKFWDFHFHEPDREYSDNEYHEELGRLLAQAVQRQMVSDVPVGSYLSGGIDSGSLVALATKNHPKMHTFTCGFDLSSASGIELGFDERNQAKSLADIFGTTHHETVLQAGDMERVIKQLLYHIEEPRVGQSYPNYYAAQLAQKHVKVVLSGDGGDELFAGYPWRYYRGATSENFEQYASLYYDFWHRLVPNSKMPQLFSPIWSDISNVSSKDIFRDVFKTHENTLDRAEDYINHSLYFEAKTFLHGLLVVEDKISMAHGIEARVPFLDNDLVDFAMRCPVRLKLNNLQNIDRIDENEIFGEKGKFFQKSKDGKQILRNVTAGLLPNKVRHGVKQGFSAPDASWFRGDSLNFVWNKLVKNDSALHSYIDRDFIKEQITLHIDGKENHRLFIWSLLSFESFLSSYSPE